MKGLVRIWYQVLQIVTEQVLPCGRQPVGISISSNKMMRQPTLEYTASLAPTFGGRGYVRGGVVRLDSYLSPHRWHYASQGELTFLDSLLSSPAFLLVLGEFMTTARTVRLTAEDAVEMASFICRRSLAERRPS